MTAPILYRQVAVELHFCTIVSFVMSRHIER